MVGHVAQLGLVAAALGDVLHLREEVQRLAVGVAHERRVDRHPHRAAGGVQVAALGAVAGELALEHRPARLPVGLEVVGVGDRGHRQALELRGRVAGDLAQRAVDAQEAEVGRGQRHPDRRLLEGGAEALLGLGQRGLGLHALGDVADGRVALDDGAGRGIAHDAQARLHPHRALCAAHAVGDRDGRSLATAEQDRDAGRVVLVHEVGERPAEELLGLEPQQVAAGGGGVAHRAVGLEHADQVGGGLGEHARALLGLEPRELGTVALGAADGDQPERVALAAQRLRADDRDQDRQQAADQQRGEREPLARGGLLDRDASTRGRRAGRACCSGWRRPAAGSSPCDDRDARAVLQVGGDGVADARGGEGGQERAGGAGAGGADGHGDGDARRRAVDGGQDLGGARLAGADRALQRGAAGRLLDRLAASGCPCRASARRRSRSARGGRGRRRRRSARARRRRRCGRAPRRSARGWSSRRSASASNCERRTDSGPCTVEATSVSRSIGPTVAWRMSFSAIASWRSWRWSRSLSPWATATQVASTVARAASASTSVWRGWLRRRSRVHEPSASGLEPSATSAMPETSSHSASAGLTDGHAWWMSRRTGTDEVPPSSTATPKAAVKTPAVLRAIRSSPAQPDASERFRSSTPSSSARGGRAQYNGCPSDVPKLLGGDLGRDDAEVRAGAELEPGQVGQPRQDVDPPAERVGAAAARCGSTGSAAARRRGGGAGAAARRAAAPRRSGPRPRSGRARGAGRA